MCHCSVIDLRSHGGSVGVTYLVLWRGLWVRKARKACIPHLTYYVLGHAKSFSGELNSAVVWVLECTPGLGVNSVKDGSGCLWHLLS